MHLFLKIMKWLGIILGSLLIVVFLFLGYLTITEYKPKEVEELTIEGESENKVSVGDSIDVLTWNIGFGALDKSADFFMDGGTQVYTATKDEVQDNMEAVTKRLQSIDADIMFLQEVDEKSSRSRNINEISLITDTFDGYMSSFAYNFKVAFVPYPIPPIGRVNSGILTLSSFELKSSVRQKLPCPFTYPVRMANLKRCLIISRMDIEGTDKDLVLINLHLEAYDNGEGKEKQTKLLKQILEDEISKGNYVIAGGDFNQVFSNVDTSDYPLIDEGLWTPPTIDVTEFSSGLTFVTDNKTPTCRSLDRPLEDNDEDFQYYMIDGFIISNNLKLNKVETIDTGFENTDHNPVLMNVTIE